jgi:hypothetical protein
MVNSRSLSFHGVDPLQSSGILSDVLKESDIYFGGSSMGKGLQKAARYYLDERLSKTQKAEYLDLPGAQDLSEECDPTPNEKPFYVVDLGVVISQVYQCKFIPKSCFHPKAVFMELMILRLL